jgi:subtilisin family serine protease
MSHHAPQQRARRRLGRRLLATGAAGALAAAMLTAHAPGASATEPAHIDSAVLADLAEATTTEFFIHLNQRPDLAPAAAMTDRTSRSAFVYDQLTATATTSQANLTRLLDAAGVAYTPFWITNAILVEGDRGLLHQLANHPDVATITAHDTVPLIAPVEISPADHSIAAVEWGVANINADQVWSDFGVTGEGIVVASIDTGVQFNHPALVNQYRGNLGGGTFDHNHNWHDPSNICSFGTPCDNNGHGTHVTGTMVGDDGGSNQIGVAPGAKWIAAKGCESNSCSQSALLSSGQWMVAPTDVNGNNADPSKAPHIVNNSWGGGPGDTWYAHIVDAWINAGIFPMFANGNAGSSCNTAGSPGDYPQSYAIGAYNINNSIANFSSRGSSQVDGGIKPNASAPGVSVRSSVPNNSYATASGTSMASPHAAGLVALVWSAESDLIGNINGTRGIIDTTARSVSDLQCGGTADNNNVWGQGRIDAHAAVEAVLEVPEPIGHIGGRVFSATTGQPLVGAQVVLSHGPGGTYQAVTGSAGTYRIMDVVAGTYVVGISAPNCIGELAMVDIIDDEITVHSAKLTGQNCGT